MSESAGRFFRWTVISLLALIAFGLLALAPVIESLPLCVKREAPAHRCQDGQELRVLYKVPEELR